MRDDDGGQREGEQRPLFESAAPDFGVYVHFPFCRKRCTFCDFAVAIRPEIPHEAYADAVLQELEARAPLFPGRQAKSIYFGGGTPGLWEPRYIGRVVDALVRRFGAPEEVTVECIPGELSLTTARGLADVGVTRLSIGVESFNDAQLLRLGRSHTAAQADTAVRIARQAGFDQVSADLLFALPGQTLGAFERELERLLSFELPHMSLYQLTLEPETPLGRSGIKTPDGADYFLMAHDRLEGLGYDHYEVSSYAQPGDESVHNGLYWRGGEYLGLGMSAHSFRRLPWGSGERFANTRDLVAYMESPGAFPITEEELPAEKLRKEAMWLWLRMVREGVPREAFARVYGCDPFELFGETIEALRVQELLEVTADGLRPTRRGMLFLDDVAMHFV